jgi:hypothetical protein
MSRKWFCETVSLRLFFVIRSKIIISCQQKSGLSGSRRYAKIALGRYPVSGRPGGCLRNLAGRFYIIDNLIIAQIGHLSYIDSRNKTSEWNWLSRDSDSNPLRCLNNL